jgi:chaperonin cofactor prefoldin
MATLKELLTEQVKLMTEAKKTLEAAQKNPPAVTAPIAAKEATVAELKGRVVNLTKAKADAIRQFDEQLGSYQTEISVLEKQIEEDKKRFGNQSPVPRPDSRRGKRRG